MNLKNATLLAIIGLCYTFASRTIGTFVPNLFRSLPAAQVNGVLLLLASLTSVVFFVYFLRDYIEKGEAELKNGTWLALVGSSLMSLLLLKGLLPMLDEYTFHSLAGPHLVEPLVPWVSSILILLFFVVFHKRTVRKGQRKLQTATLWAVIGSLVGVLLRTFTASLYIYSTVVRWFSDFPRMMQLIFLPIFAFSFLAILYFFTSFYREQRQIS
jgi:hypothetical protein